MGIPSYVIRHWKGEHSLAVSFWINIVLISLVYRAITIIIGDMYLNDFATANHYIVSSVDVIGWIIGVWQLVGAWRASHQWELRKYGKIKFGGWGGLVKVYIIFCFIFVFHRIVY